GVLAATGFIVTIRENLALAAQLPVLAMSIAAAGAFLAAIAIRIRHVVGHNADVTQPSVPWYGVLVAWRGPAAWAGILSFALASISLHAGTSVVPTYPALSLPSTAFLLASGYHSRNLTWLGSSLG